MVTLFRPAVGLLILLIPSLAGQVGLAHTAVQVALSTEQTEAAEGTHFVNEKPGF